MITRFLPRTLFGRSLVIIVTPVVLLQLIATYVFYERHWDSVARRLAKGVGGEIAAVIEGLRTLSDEGDRARLVDRARRHMRLKVTFRPGEKLPEAVPPGLRINPFTTLDQILDRSLRDRLVDPFRFDTVSLPDNIEILVQLEDGVLQVIVRDKRVFSSTTYIFILWMVGSSLVLLAIAIIFLRNQMRPIRHLAEAAESFGKGREVADFRPSGASEVRQAAGAFLEMRDRITRQITQRTELLAGVSHDLRTPLTRMKLQLALLGDGAEQSDLKSDVDEMERMVDGYLAFARGQDTEAAVETDLPALLGEVVSDVRRQGGEIRFEPNGALSALIRPNAFKRCITNLVENARRHAATVAITATRHADSIEIVVEDDGPGIPAAEREAVFRPFHRLEQSRNRATGGSGLGLTIARDVARGHGGDLTLSDAPAGGLRAVVRLPV